ncbi:hypothetical protein HPB48_023618 [Haemaphysalis longicornis]|uniref:Uncharacterized protein n=1 Tax=Haemaphysalis longicornis TaxID=44386 RepID=A0A9J6H8D6_HAELO|nr:hypothetical protein HPB48_023618 [Haemaphysalis longicornis]
MAQLGRTLALVDVTVAHKALATGSAGSATRVLLAVKDAVLVLPGVRQGRILQMDCGGSLQEARGAGFAFARAASCGLLRSVGTEEAAVLVAAVDAAEVALDDNPPSSGGAAGEGGVTRQVNPLKRCVDANPPMDSDMSLHGDVSSLGRSFSLMLNDPRNKVPCSVRDKVMDSYFKLQEIIVNLIAGKARADGQVLELRRQLAASQARSPSAEGGVPVRSPTLAEVLVRPAGAATVPARPTSPSPSRSASVAGGRGPEHALHIRLTTPSSSPASDIATMLKSTFNPFEIGVGPVMFRPSRVGLTVTAQLSACSVVLLGPAVPLVQGVGTVSARSENPLSKRRSEDLQESGISTRDQRFQGSSWFVSHPP